MGWIELVYKIAATLVAVSTLFKFVRSEIKRLCGKRKGAGHHSKKSGS